MLRQRNNTGDRKNEAPRKNTTTNAGRSGSERTPSIPTDRNRTDNTRVVRMDPHRLNDLYERSSI